MGTALFSQVELTKHKSTLAALEKKYGVGKREKHANWNEYWAAQKGLAQAHAIETIRRAQKRPEDFLNGLLILVGNRGGVFLDFESAFSKKTDPEVAAEIESCSTPAIRRDLYTFLRGFAEAPKSWAASAMIRFFRGIGKQKGAKYHGAGMFGTAYGWKTKEVDAICHVLAGDRWNSERVAYGACLMTYVDVEQEIIDEDPDYEVIDYDTKFVATRAERDVEFIDKLCAILEDQGLGPIPHPKVAKAKKKKRKPKQFKPGDKIRRATIRDLPLPAHIRIEIERRDKDSDSKEWYGDHLEQVVVAIHNNGHYIPALVVKDKAFLKKGSFNATWGQDKKWLEGATFLGKWDGSIADKRVEPKFHYRQAN